MTKFQAIYKELKQKSNITDPELAKILGVSVRTLDRWKIAEREQSSDVLDSLRWLTYRSKRR